jgi:hypothetical protein
MIGADFKSFLHSIVETLDRLGLLYAIGGSVASSIYGEARSTLDVDISVTSLMPGADSRPTFFPSIRTSQRSKNARCFCAASVGSMIRQMAQPQSFIPLKT